MMDLSLKPRPTPPADQISIRPYVNVSAYGEMRGLSAYRKFDRSYALGQAWKTPSGRWIVSVTQQTMDVADDEKAAKDLLLKMVLRRDKYLPR